jgi:hypothetical protein
MWSSAILRSRINYFLFKQASHFIRLSTEEHYMTAIYFDSTMNDELRRQRLYAGDIFVFSPNPSIQALCDLAREMVEAGFDELDPITAQYHMPVERFVEIFAPIKPKFIHHPKTKQLFQKVVADFGCDSNKTYIDVPRLRAVTHGGYLTSGVGYAHHPHRDTWYSAPMCQINWWIPLYGFESESSMAFHPRYWNNKVSNGSADFNYFEWNANGRKNAAKQVKEDTRKQPRPSEAIELEPEIRIVCPPGGAILFSAAQLHSTVPNTSGRTRFSMDIRTLHVDDVLSMRGAPNVDSNSPTTSLRDFVRANDLIRMPEDIAARFDKVTALEGELIFKANS